MNQTRSGRDPRFYILITKNTMQKNIKVLSLFDGMSCGMIALERAGIKVDKYYSSEIDKYAIQVSSKNYPEIVRLGDINNRKEWDLSDIDMIIGGSPCQGFSFAGKQLAFDDPRSKLFFTMVDIINHYKPKYFLLENVKMKKEHQAVITEYMGVEPIEINSALVSAQNRKRLYRTNIIGIKQPKDKGILLKNIILDEVDEKYNISEIQWEKLRNYESNSRLSPLKGKCVSLTTMQGGHRQPKIAYAPGSIEFELQGWKEDKSPTLRARDYKDPKVICNGIKVRKLTPLECERLQTVPDNYTDAVSNSQRYKMLGNGWTVDVIAHIFSYLI